MARLWRRDASRSCARRACRLCGRSLVWLRNPRLGARHAHVLCEGVRQCPSTQRRQQAPVASLRLSPGWSHLSSGSRRCTSPAVIAIRKGRSPWLGLVLGLLLSWIGLLIVALLPRKGPRVAQTPGSSRRTRRSRRERVSGRPHRCRRPPLPQEAPQAAPAAPEASSARRRRAAPPIATASEPAPPAPPLRVVPSPPADVVPPGNERPPEV